MSRKNLRPRCRHKVIARKLIDLANINLIRRIRNISMAPKSLRKYLMNIMGTKVTLHRWDITLDTGCIDQWWAFLRSQCMISTEHIGIHQHHTGILIVLHHLWSRILDILSLILWNNIQWCIHNITLTHRTMCRCNISKITTLFILFNNIRQYTNPNNIPMPLLSEKKIHRSKLKNSMRIRKRHSD